MGNVHIVSTLQNKAMQKKSVHLSSSTVFLAVCSGDGQVDTEVSLLNHFILKRGISDVVATVEFRDLKGDLVSTYKMNMNEPRAYSILVSEHVNGEFLGSVYVYFNSNENTHYYFKSLENFVKLSQNFQIMLMNSRKKCMNDFTKYSNNLK